MHDPRFHILKVPENEGTVYGSLLHREHIASPLKMVVRKNGAAHNGQIGVGTEEIVGQKRDKIQELSEGFLGNGHRNMLFVENDAMLIVVHIGRILHHHGRAAKC